MEEANKRHKMSLCSHLESTHYLPPEAHQPVYKDECCTCFYSQDDARGIDVCLDCFHAGCLEPGREHAYGHYTLTQHAVTLNIRRREKPRKETPVTKIAVAAETDADRYSYETSLRCYACAFETSETPATLTSVVDGIMNALSTIQQSEVKAWEQEMTACEHTLTLQQEPAKTLADSSLATCSDCSLSENLWLCLVCGKLSCGRQQFGGGGGNGHGLQHVDASGHGLAVKLGSITPEGTADVYCYTCDEERLDPMLADHLAHWGILLHGRVKTEKSLQELQVEQNLKWDFSMQTDDGKDMTPLFGPGLTGLKNIGNSCYLASILQCLFALPAFAERFLTPFQQDPIDIVREPVADLEVQMRKMADGLLSGLFSTPHQHGDVQVQYGIAPTLFKNLVGKGHPEFSTMRQQDAMEFLLHLCNQLETLETPAGLPNPTDAFKFCTEQRTQCQACKRVAYKTERQEHVSILVPAQRLPDSDAYAPVSMETLLDLYTAEEHVDWTCPACTAKEGAIKSTRFKTFPAVLVLNPGRFALENWVPAKLEIPIVMPTTLSLDKYRATGLQPGEESLPDDAVAASPATTTANEDDVEMLMSMGFPRVRSEKALLTTGAGTEAAMEWLFAHMDDADIDEPYKAPASGKQEANVALVGDLTEMGFPKHLAIKGLLATGNADVQAALEWVMQHMDDPETEEVPQTETLQVQVEQDTRPAEYTCRALVCHKGTSVHAGHYIAYVKRALGQDADGDWVLMNDEKVVRGVAWEEAARTGYVYFMERKM